MKGIDIENKIYELPKAKGELKKKYKLSQINWFKVGGDAEVLFIPKNFEDLKYFLKELNNKVPVIILGAGSNILIRDGGLGGIVIKLGKAFSELEVFNELYVKVGAAYNCIKLSRKLAKWNLSGLEFFSGIPGTIGGAVYMNAGAFGSETSSVLEEIKILDRKGNLKKYTKEELKMSYRKSSITKSQVITEAVFKCKKKDGIKVLKKIKELEHQRNITQPIKYFTGGSTFKNPKDNKAWKLIKESGCQGMQVGGAKLSKLHANFIINSGKCTSSDIENLGEKIRDKVEANSGIKLEWEIKILGSKEKYKRYFNG